MMKKFVALLSLFALAVGPVVTIAADDPADATTSLTRATGGGMAPIVKAKWEELPMVNGVYPGTDEDMVAAGAQFLPTGAWNTNKTFTICSIVTDPNGAADIDKVYADLYYPTPMALHDLTTSTDEHLDTRAGANDQGQGACGAFIRQITLNKLDKNAGYELFCHQIKDHNNNLPTIYSPYNYNEICNQDGELQKETAYVFCGDTTVRWEDPAGKYRVTVNAFDKSGNSSTYVENQFDYLKLASFEKDFSNVSYGEVMYNTKKLISGNLTFDGTNSLTPTIRNTGNTRLWVKVAQDDMGLGQTDPNLWNVAYEARVGNFAADWTGYNPFGFKGTYPVAGDYKVVEDILDLSETEEMDFSILVKKWPSAATSYTGSVWLDLQEAPFRICGAKQN